MRHSPTQLVAVSELWQISCVGPCRVSGCGGSLHCDLWLCHTAGGATVARRTRVGAGKCDTACGCHRVASRRVARRAASRLLRRAASRVALRRVALRRASRCVAFPSPDTGEASYGGMGCRRQASAGTLARQACSQPASQAATQPVFFVFAVARDFLCRVAHPATSPTRHRVARRTASRRAASRVAPRRVCCVAPRRASRVAPRQPARHTPPLARRTLRHVSGMLPLPESTLTLWRVGFRPCRDVAGMLL